MERKQIRRLAAVMSMIALAGSVASTQVVRPARSSQCNAADRYAQGLCLYAAGEYDQAAGLFRELADSEVESPRAVRAMYFLARTQMKRKQWSDASGTLIRIYSLAPAFYKEWNCDFLLGEARRGMGLE